MSITEILPSPTARNRILSVAGPLFYRHGTRAIGIDRVIAGSDVAKATFYRHFPSKDDLIVAWLESAAALDAKGRPDPDGPRALTDWVEGLLAAVRDPRCLGCPMQGTAAEFGDAAHPAHVAARTAKDATLADLVRRARAEGLVNPEDTAAEVFLLVEGLLAATRMFGPDTPVDAAERGLRRILAAAML